MADLIESTKEAIADCLKELEPVVAEVARLEAALAALSPVGGSGPSPALAGTRTRARRVSRTSKRGRASRAGAGEASEAPATTKSGGARTKRRPKASSGREVQAVSLIVAQPGITIPELAKKMGMSRTGLYRVLPGPEMEGKIRREGTGWWPAGSD